MKLRIGIIILACLMLLVPLTACGNGEEVQFNLPGDTNAQTLATTTPIEEGTWTMPENMTNPVATITMADGSQIIVELFPETTPNTVNNFIALAQQGFYDGLIFHRVIPGFMIQGGCPQGMGFDGPGYTIACETANNVPHTPGVLSMAHAGPNTGGSQFFIMHGDAPWLNGVHTAFGQVRSGMDVVNRIAGTQTGANDRPVAEQRIQSITIETHGVDFPAPVTGPAR